MYATYRPAGIYELDNGRYRKVEPCYISPNHKWLVFETPGGFVIDNNENGKRETATMYGGPFSGDETEPYRVGYDWPQSIPQYVRNEIARYVKSDKFSQSMHEYRSVTWVDYNFGKGVTR